MKTVKAYDIKALVEGVDGHNLTAFGSDAQLVIMVGPKGVLIVTTEGVHYRFDSVEDSYEVDCCPNESDKIYAIPSATLSATIKELMEEAASNEIHLGNFVRRFGERLETNYQILLDSIREVGLDPMDYPRDVQSASNQG
jgi:hypothetical protein